VVTVGPDCPLDVVLGLMNLNRIAAVVVIHNDRSLVGIFTERDLLRRVAVANPGWQSLPVSAWMTSNPHTIEPGVGWEAALRTLERLRVRHLPVVEAGDVIGLISPRMLVARREEYLSRAVEERTRELRLANEHLLARDAESRANLRAAGRASKTGFSRLTLRQTGLNSVGESITPHSNTWEAITTISPAPPRTTSAS
jgi:sigma-B regulation protein RsbU (phosphoserine phosphatase)